MMADVTLSDDKIGCTFRWSRTVGRTGVAGNGCSPRWGGWIRCSPQVRWTLWCSAARFGAALRVLDAHGAGEKPVVTCERVGPALIFERLWQERGLRAEAKATCGKVFQAVGVALPPTVRRLEDTAQA